MQTPELTPTELEQLSAEPARLRRRIRVFSSRITLVPPKELAENSVFIFLHELCRALVIVAPFDRAETLRDLARMEEEVNHEALRELFASTIAAIHEAATHPPDR